MANTTPVKPNPRGSIITDPIRNFKFVVTFDPVGEPDSSLWGANFGRLGFVSVSGLSVTTDSIAYREGGYNTNVHQIPGQTSFSPITLSKGIMLGNDVHSLWMKRLFSVLTGRGTTGVGADFRCDVEIQVLSHPNPKAYETKGSTKPVEDIYNAHTSLRFKVYNAWITSLAYSNLDAGANTLMVEELTLVHEGFDVNFATSYDATAPIFPANAG